MPTSELRTKFRLGGTYGALYRCWGGRTKGYSTNLVQGSSGAGDHIGMPCLGTSMSIRSSGPRIPRVQGIKSSWAWVLLLVVASPTYQFSICQA